MYEGLDQRDQQIIAVIREWQARGAVPTYRDIRDAAGIGSTATVAGRLARLAAKGHVHLGTERNQRRAITLVRESAPVSVPLLGTIRAGRPLLAEEQIEARYLLPPEFVGKGELFMLRVVGDSMVEAAVSDGDYVVVRRQPVAEDGELVAARLGEEVTLKRLARDGPRVRLLPANPAYPPLELGEDGEILGKVVTVVRHVEA